MCLDNPISDCEGNQEMAWEFAVDSHAWDFIKVASLMKLQACENIVNYHAFPWLPVHSTIGLSKQSCASRDIPTARRLLQNIGLPPVSCSASSTNTVSGKVHKGGGGGRQPNHQGVRSDGPVRVCAAPEPGRWCLGHAEGVCGLRRETP